MADNKSENSQPQSDQESQVDWARQRTMLAVDRTLLAWIRTALTLIAFGFTLSKFVHGLVKNNVGALQQAAYPRVLGLSMMSLGVLGLAGGAYEYYNAARKLGNSSYNWSASLIVALVIGVIGVFLMVAISFEPDF